MEIVKLSGAYVNEKNMLLHWTLPPKVSSSSFRVAHFLLGLSPWILNQGYVKSLSILL